MPISKVQKAFLYRLFSKYFKIVLILIILLLLFGSYFLLLNPKIDQIRRDREVELKNKINQLASRESYLVDLKALTSSYKKLSDTELRRINLILPSEEDFPNIFTQLEALVEDNGIFLQAMDISKVVVELKEESKLPKNIRRLNISLSLSGGDYNTFRNFLADIEFNIRTFDITSLSFTPDFTSYFIVLTSYYSE